MKIKTILATKGKQVVTIRPEQSVREAACLLDEHNIGALVVVDEAGKLVGIIADHDIIRLIARHEDALSQPVSQFMTTSVITGMPQDDVIAVAHTMAEKRFHHLPIMDKGDLVGIVSIGDIVKAQRDQYRGEIDTLHTQIIADQP